MACAYCTSVALSGPCPCCAPGAPVTFVKASKRPTPSPRTARPAVQSPKPTIASPAPRAVPAPVQTPSRVPSVPRAPQHLRVADAVYRAWEGGQKGTALTLMAGEMGGPLRDLRVSVLLAIDVNASIRGYLTREDEGARQCIATALHIEWMDRHGFDPRFHPDAQEAARVSTPWKTDPSTARTVVDMPAVIPLTQVVVEQAAALIPPPAPKALPPVRDPLKSGDWAGLDAMVKRGELSEREAEQIGLLWLSYTGAGTALA